MYLLDTNVVSELRKIESGRVNPRVETWVESIDAELLFLSVVTVLELEIGVLSLESRDRIQGRSIRKWLNTRVMPSFAGRIVAIDLAVAIRCAAMNLPDRRPRRDAWLAATADIPPYDGGDTERYGFRANRSARAEPLGGLN